jgi:hypothetical protein
VHVTVLIDLAGAEGIDRYFGTPRNRVGGFQSATMVRHGLPEAVTLLPMRGDRWPDAAIRRCDEIARATCRAMRTGVTP